MLEGRVQELTEARDAARAEVEASTRRLVEVKECSRVEIERVKLSLVEARKEVKPRAARRIAAAEARARHEHDRAVEFTRQLGQFREQLAAEIADRVAGEQERERLLSEVERLTALREEANQTLATLDERLNEVEGTLADEREKRLASEHEARELAEAEHAARAAAQGSEERLAQALSVLSDGGGAHS